MARLSAQDPSPHTELALTAISLASSCSPGDLASAGLTPDGLRALLQEHLDASALYDMQRVLEAVRGSLLAAEQVILYRKVCVYV